MMAPKPAYVALAMLICGPALAGAAPPWRGRTVRIPLDAAMTSTPMPQIAGPPGRPLIVIDAGHGGHDPGTLGASTGIAEKALTLAVAQRIRRALLTSGRVRVALTRDRDVFLVLRERTAIARHLKADLFLSIHADSGDTMARGASIYTLSDIASDREAQDLALRENKADILNGINLAGKEAGVTSILVDLAQRETMAQSVAFAQVLRREGAGLIPFHASGLRQADLAVLKAPDMPAALLEVGYLSHNGDARRIASASGQRDIAEAVRRAVDIYFARQRADRVP